MSCCVNYIRVIGNTRSAVHDDCLALEFSRIYPRFSLCPPETTPDHPEVCT